MSVTTYDPGNVKLTINGIQMSGFADSSFIEVAPAEPRSSTKVSADGKVVTRVKSRNRAGSMTVTFLDGSESNAFLATLDKLDDEGVNVIFAVAMEDNVNTEIFASSAWIEEAPTRTYGKESGTSAWKFGIANVSHIVSPQSANMLAIVGTVANLIEDIF